MALFLVSCTQRRRLTILCIFSVLILQAGGAAAEQVTLQPHNNPTAFSFFFFLQQKESEKRNVTVQADDPISFMQLTAKNEMTSKEDQFQLSLLAAMGNTQRKEAADPLASKLNKVNLLKSNICFCFFYHLNA